MTDVVTDTSKTDEKGSQEPRKLYLVLAAVLIVLSLLTAILGVFLINRATTGDPHAVAINACLNQVQDDVTYPNAATFLDHSITEESDTVFVVEGAMRTVSDDGSGNIHHYECTVVMDGGDVQNIEHTVD